jgi:hypothetical protein
MKKLFVLIALGGMGAFAVGCGDSATPPAPPANPASGAAGHSMHMSMQHGAKTAGHDAAGGEKKDDAAPSDEDKKDDAAPGDKKEGE